MDKFRKKPVVIEAIQLTEETVQECYNFIGANGNFPECGMGIDPDDGQFKITTLEGVHIANIGDYIIKGVKGEFYPCKPDIFEMTYEKDLIRTSNLTFGDAIEALKQGRLVTRDGWNGKGMFLFIRPEDSLSTDFIINKVKSLPESLKNYYISQHSHTIKEELEGESPKDTYIKFTKYICMKAADGSIVNGWLASQTDILSEDWIII